MYAKLSLTRSVDDVSQTAVRVRDTVVFSRREVS
jgi:hypothetical protein